MTDPSQLKIITVRSGMLRDWAGDELPRAQLLEYAPDVVAYMDGHITRPEFVLLIDLVRLKKKAGT